jgi:energy-coupling factor transporter ATP-binding protein EcfA2
MALKGVYAGCPPLSSRIAQHITNPKASSDMIVCVEGRKGSGKSTLCLQLAEQIAVEIARIKGNGCKPSDFFDITHVCSIEHDGALQLLTSGKLQRKNQIFILDDVSTMWGNRRSMTLTNQALNDIAMICRVYESVLLVNTVTRAGVDLVLRQLSDLVIKMYSRSTVTNQSLFKAYLVDHNSKGEEILKFFTWVAPDKKKRRINWWIGGLPSPELNTAYKQLRLEATNAHITEAGEKLKERRGEKDPDKKQKTVHPNIEKYKALVGAMYDTHTRTTDIAIKTGLSRYWIEKCIAAHLNGGNDDV